MHAEVEQTAIRRSGGEEPWGSEGAGPEASHCRERSTARWAPRCTGPLYRPSVRRAAPPCHVPPAAPPAAVSVAWYCHRPAVARPSAPATKHTTWFHYHTVGNLSGNELTSNLSGNIRPQSSQLAEPLWTDSSISSGISVREQISASKWKKKKSSGRERMVEHSPKSPRKRGKSQQTLELWESKPYRRRGSGSGDGQIMGTVKIRRPDSFCVVQLWCGARRCADFGCRSLEWCYYRSRQSYFLCARLLPHCGTAYVASQLSTAAQQSLASATL